MPKSTLTSKGQVTIPKSIRDRLSLKVGDRLIFRLDRQGVIKVQRESAAEIENLQGILRHLRRRKPVSVEEMRESLKQRAAHKLARSSKR
jgi:antitoxin PrlF